MNLFYTSFFISKFKIFDICKMYILAELFYEIVENQDLYRNKED